MSNSTPSSQPITSDSTAPAITTPGPNSSDVTAPAAETTSTLASSAGTMPERRTNRTRNVTRRAVHKAPPNFVQLARTPLIPERILRQYGAYSWYDERFRAAARLLQCLWLRERDIPTASSQANATDSPAAIAGFGSILSVEAANAGRNFLSSAIYRHALHSWLMSEPGACYEEVRFFGNSLSSMPLVFNLLAPLAVDIGLASQVLRRLLPGIVQRVERIQFETSPGRRDTRFNRRGEGPYLGDRSAFDCAFHSLDPSGTPCIVYTEIKYSETLDHTNIAKMRDRYAEASRQVRLYENPDSLILRSPPIEQFWREHMLAQLAVDNGVTPKAVFLAIGPELNRRVQGAFQVYQGELIDADRRDPSRVPFIPLTLETVIRAIADAGAIDHARALWDRYCDFERVYRLSLQELAGDASFNSTPTTKPSNEAQLRSPPPTRRNSASTNARLPKAASTPTRGNTANIKTGAVERSTP